MNPRGRLLSLLALGAAAAIAWTSLGVFDVAAGKDRPVLIARAHEGERAPSYSKPIFLLTLGGDARNGNPTHVRMDSIHIVAIDPVSMTASIVGIPRDSWVDLPGRGKDKINSAGYFGGPELMIKAVEKLSNCSFDYYTLTSFRNFTTLVDQFGGITLNVPRRMYEKGSSHINLFPGVQRLDGKQALAWSRNRHQRPRGDFDRSEAQGQLMVAALAEAQKDYGDDAGTSLRNLATLRKNLNLNIPLDEGLKLGLFALRIKPENVRNIVLDGGTGTSSGGASIVEITQKGLNQLQDVCTDGVLDQP